MCSLSAEMRPSIMPSSSALMALIGFLSSCAILDVIFRLSDSFISSACHSVEGLGQPAYLVTAEHRDLFFQTPFTDRRNRLGKTLDRVCKPLRKNHTQHDRDAAKTEEREKKQPVRHLMKTPLFLGPK